MIRIDSEIINRAQHGCQDSAVFVCKSTEPLTRKISRIIPQWWKEDAMQAGRLGTIVAIRKYDPLRSPDFGTFAGQYIKNEVNTLYNQCVNMCGIPKKIMAEYMKVKRDRPEVTILSNGMKIHDLDMIMKAVSRDIA